MTLNTATRLAKPAANKHTSNRVNALVFVALSKVVYGILESLRHA